MKIAIDANLQQQARRVGRAASLAEGMTNPRAANRVIDKLPQEAGGMIVRHPVLQGGREKELLSVIRAMGEHMS